DGISRVRVDDVMARAGLTHDGFYSHFDSKADLLREALDYAAEQTVEALSKPLADMPSEDRWRTMIDSHLNPAHVAHPEGGCPRASLGPEIARADSPTHKRLAVVVRGRLAWMRQLLPQRRRPRRLRRVCDWLGGVYGGRRDPGARCRWQRGERHTQCV